MASDDTPALAAADVGITMGAAGGDVAIEAADVALLGEDLRHLPATLDHARRAGRIMRQNLAMSGAFPRRTRAPLAATASSNLAAVVATHELAEVFVIANGVARGRRTRLELAPLPTSRCHRSTCRRSRRESLSRLPSPARQALTAALVAADQARRDGDARHPMVEPRRRPRLSRPAAFAHVRVPPADAPGRMG